MQLTARDADAGGPLGGASPLPSASAEVYRASPDAARGAVLAACRDLLLERVVSGAQEPKAPCKIRPPDRTADVRGVSAAQSIALASGHVSVLC